MDRRSHVRATQLQGGSSGSMRSSHSTNHHHLGQQMVVQLVLVALPMRRLQLVECAAVGEGEDAARGTLAADTRRQRRHSLHAIPT